MVRATALLIVTLAALCASAAARAQTQSQLPPCKIAAAARVMNAGGEPNFIGCALPDAAKLLLSRDYQVTTKPAKPRPGVSVGTIVDQARSGRQYTFAVVLATAPTDTTPPDTPPATSERPSPTFSITDAAPVVEGGKLSFPVVRTGNDGKIHHLKISYSDRTSLRNPPDTIDIYPLDSAPMLTLDTNATPPGDGDHRVMVLISPGDDGSRIGAPRSASGVISDAPPPAPPPEQTLYSVAPVGEASRGASLRFLVTRSGPLPATTVIFEVNDSGYVQQRIEEDEVSFAEGEARHEIVMRRGRYAFCSVSVAITLRNVAGEQLSAEQFLAEPPPEECNPEPWWHPFVPPGRLSWVIPIIVVVCGTTLWWWRRRPDPIDDADDETAPEPEDTTAPALPITAATTIKPGDFAFDPPDDVMGRWSPFRSHVVIVRGDSEMPDPLPSGETSGA